MKMMSWAVKFVAIWHGFFVGNWHGTRTCNRYKRRKASLYNIADLIGRCRRGLKTRLEGSLRPARLSDRRFKGLHAGSVLSG